MTQGETRLLALQAEEPPALPSAPHDRVEFCAGVHALD